MGCLNSSSRMNARGMSNAWITREPAVKGRSATTTILCVVRNSRPSNAIFGTLRSRESVKNERVRVNEERVGRGGPVRGERGRSEADGLMTRKLFSRLLRAASHVPGGGGDELDVLPLEQKRFPIHAHRGPVRDGRVQRHRRAEKDDGK